MKRFKNPWLALLIVVVSNGLSSGLSWAEMSMKLALPGGQEVEVTGHNVARGDDSLILYDKDYGKSTRTNPYGVEVIAVPTEDSLKEGKAFRVVGLTSVWECSQSVPVSSGTQVACGDASIPTNGGVVLSSTGAKRDLLKSLKVGDFLVLKTQWFQQQQSKISVTDPTPANNPLGSGFPGYRASNQLVVYDPNYVRPTTGTNEFGFEVTVRNGMVVAQEGSDSMIPPDGFVLSGHGRGRSWLIANAPVGAKIALSPDGQMVTASIDFDTYQYQFDQHWAQSPCESFATGGLQTDRLCHAVKDKRDRALALFAEGQTNQAAVVMQEALEGLNRRLWLSYKPFPAETVRGVWHRPVEKNAAEIGKTLDNLKAAGLNAVFLETYFHGYTIFPSRTFEAYGLPKENPKFGDVDLLQLWVEQAHQRGMQVHVWFQTFYAGTKAYLPPGPILSRYPSWANVQYSALIPVAPPTVTPAPLPGTVAAKSDAKLKPSAAGQKPAEPNPADWPKKTPEQPVASTLELGAYFLDPANPDVRSFLIKLSDEIVSRYNIDGFQLDYIRYPASFPADRFSYRKTTWGYTNLARNGFKKLAGIDPADIDPKRPEYDSLWRAWNEYKTNQVTSFVQQVTQSMHTLKPNLRISAAVFPEADSALVLKHQDWRLWAQNRWIDFFAPMTLTSANKVVDRDTRYMVGVTKGSVPVYSGIFGPFNDNTAEHVLSQIDVAKQAGASGYVLFDTAHLTPRMLEALKAVQIPQPVVTAPAMTSPAPHPSAPTPEASTGKAKKHHWWNRK